MRKRALSDAYAALVDADGLAKNVRKLGQIEAMEIGDLHPMDLVATITDSFERLTQAMKAPDIVLNLSGEEEKHFIYANDLLQDIFLNLFRNAIEYSETGTVAVKISSIKRKPTNFWEIKIIDHGQGIPYNVRESLFDRYMKGAKESGLGLSVVKALTELFRGTVRIEDRVKGDYSQGSVFVLEFPAVL